MGTENLNLLCMSCFSQLHTVGGVCPVCGYNQASQIESPYQLPLRTILAGKYLVGRVLGEGGFGITYIGYDLNLDIKVAVKEYYPSGFVTRANTVSSTVQPFGGEQGDIFAKGRDRFVDEAKRLARFRMLPGIVMVSDFFVENGTAYIVMEYVEGQTLKSALAQAGGKLPAAQVFEMLRPVFASLAQVHETGIIHRDISPDNIMITNEGYVKLLDFGAAREFGEEGNKSLSVMLKHGYAPMEQYSSKGRQGPQTDVYALSATIYKAISGVTPEGSMDRIIEDTLAPPSRVGAVLPPHQEAALMKGLAVRQEDRFQTVSELYAALLGGQPLTGIHTGVPGQGNSQLNYVPHPAGQPPRPLRGHPSTEGNYMPPQVPSQIPAVSYVPSSPNSQLSSLNSQLSSPISQMGTVPPSPNSQLSSPNSQLPAKPRKPKIIAAVVASCAVIAIILILALQGSPSDGLPRGEGPSASSGGTTGLGLDDILVDGKIDPSAIPDLTGNTYLQAAEKLGELEIPFVSTAEYSNTLEPGTLISYSLDEDAERVRLVLSAGRQPDGTGDIMPPLQLGFTTNYYGGRGVSGTVAVLTNGDPRIYVVQVGIEEPDYYEGLRQITSWGGFEEYEPRVLTWNISALVQGELSNAAYDGRLNYADYDLRPAFQGTSRNWDMMSGLMVSDINLRIVFTRDAAPEIEEVTLVSGPEDINEWGNGRVTYLLTGSFWQGARYQVNISSNQMRTGGEFNCKKDGELEVTGWVNIDSRDGSDGYMPSRVEIIECISFSLNEAAGTGLAEFSRMSVWTGSRIDASQIPNLIGWRYPDAMNALRPLGQLTYGFEAAHSASHPAGTIMEQDFSADFGYMTLVFSAGPEPAAGADPKPIILGTAIETERWSGEDAAIFRWITPKVREEYYSYAWYQPASGSNAWWSSFGYGECSMEEPLVNYYSFDWMGYNMFYQHNYGSLPSYDGDDTLRIGVSMHRYDADWEDYSELPASRKAESEERVRMTVSRFNSGTSAIYIGSDSFEEEWQPGYMHTVYKYFLTGDIVNNTNYYYSIRMLDDHGNESFWEHNRDYRDGGMEVSIYMDEYYLSQGMRPAYLVMFSRDGSTDGGAGGVVTVSSSYDIIGIDYAGVEPPRPAVTAPDYEDYYIYQDASHLRGDYYSIHSFYVVGSSSGSVWGTDIYTDDSNIGTAAVHAGLLNVGEEGYVDIIILPGEGSYEGSTRYGITSSSYGTWGGSYAFYW